jgi:hypothetical protein
MTVKVVSGPRALVLAEVNELRDTAVGKRFGIAGASERVEIEDGKRYTVLRVELGKGKR